VLKEIRDKNVTVVGLARSGIGAANLLSELGAKVTVTDTKTEEELKDLIPKINQSVRRILGSHPEDVFVDADFLVVSPGVPLDIRPLLSAKSRNVPIFGELELAYQVIGMRKAGAGSRTEFLAVTGTNGKSTTTALLDFMMKKAGFRTILGGNIGNAVTEEISKISTGRDYIVVEVSSFQLESIKDFRPKVAALLNITPDHLDRYPSFEAYGAAKARIFENQTADDLLVLNRDDHEVMKTQNEKLGTKIGKPKVIYFSRKQEVEGLYFKDGIIYCNTPGAPFAPCLSPLIRAEEIRIKGVHNLENAMAASAMALLAGSPVEAVRDSLREFTGLEHRLEFVRELGGVVYFNDSKGTNVDAVIKSIESFSQPVILIAGGRDKAGDFSRLKKAVRERIKALVLIGEAAEKIEKALGDATDTVIARDLRDATLISRNRSAPGDAVLLSPACASFDMFENFEDRGRQFKSIVMEMH
jgi:UDP-N-acetylmuramoylalanine--D-glutamate ligase